VQEGSACHAWRQQSCARRRHRASALRAGLHTAAADGPLRAALRQADGVMGRLAADAGVLGAMLDALCGWERPADGDRVVREALAEALLMLVGPGISSMWFLAPGFRPACDADVAECCGVLECVPHGRSALA